MLRKEKRKKIIESDTEEWFILIEHQQIGPFKTSDLKQHPLFTPDTLVWKKGFKEWIKARFIPELQDLFKDDPQSSPLLEENGKGLKTEVGQESQATLTLQQDPYQFLLWILLLLIVIYYTFFYHY